MLGSVEMRAAVEVLRYGVMVAAGASLTEGVAVAGVVDASVSGVVCLEVERRWTFLLVAPALPCVPFLEAGMLPGFLSLRTSEPGSRE